MRIYFERWIICNVCGESQRQTSITTSFDWIGRVLHRMFREEFMLEHESCNSTVRYTSWRLGSIFKR